MLKFLGLVAFLVAMLALYYLVPRDKIKEHSAFALLAGPVLGLILLYFMCRVYGFWNFGPLDLFILGIPIFSALVWYPLEVAFAYYFEHSRNPLMYFILVLSLPIFASFSHYLMLYYGLLDYRNWTLLYTFFQSLLIHIILAVYLYYKHRVDVAP